MSSDESHNSLFVSHRRYYWIIGLIATIIIAALIDYHWRKIGILSHWYLIFNAFAFLSLLAQLGLAHSNEDFEAMEIVHRNICVIVPVYNEDPMTFRALLESLTAQTRRPDYVYVIDDGSTNDDCAKIFELWNDGTIPATFHVQENAGKREAQTVAFRSTPNADIYVTVDSDTVLDGRAIEQGIKPIIGEDKVQSVAGLLLGLNHRRNLLTRLVDISFVTSFMTGRASWSRMHSVSVNCGGLSFYRAETIRKYLDEYTNQRVFGRIVSSGDDRVLTNLALLDGWAVFQESSVGYTLHPANIRHLTKQRIRWWRSFFWGGEWFIRRISPRRLVWWLIVSQFHDFVLYTLILFAVVPYFLIASPIAHHHIPLLLFGYLGLLGYVRNIRYLGIKRPDQSFISQFGLWLLSPLSVILNVYLCTVLSYIGLFTVWVTGWSTRQNVEVGLESE